MTYLIRRTNEMSTINIYYVLINCLERPLDLSSPPTAYKVIAISRSLWIETNRERLMSDKEKDWILLNKIHHTITKEEISNFEGIQDSIIDVDILHYEMGKDFNIKEFKSII